MGSFSEEIMIHNAFGTGMTKQQQFATCTSPIMHLNCPPKILHKHCFQFPLGRLLYPVELKNKGYEKFGG